MFQEAERTTKLFEVVVFNGSEIAPGGDFMLYAGDFVIYQIWRTISVAMGAISAGESIRKFWIDFRK